MKSDSRITIDASIEVHTMTHADPAFQVLAHHTDDSFSSPLMLVIRPFVDLPVMLLLRVLPPIIFLAGIDAVIVGSRCMRSIYFPAQPRFNAHAFLRIMIY